MLMISKSLKAIAGFVAIVSMVFAMGAAYAGSEAGLVKDTKGTVTIERGDKKFAAKSGSSLLVSDIVVTGADSTVGITLHDGTLLSAGPNSTLTLNKFAFDTTTQKGALDASLKRGTLAVVSGKLSKTSSAAVTYRTPSSILGVRGTEFVLEAGGEN